MTPSITLTLGETTELGELLEFVDDWLRSAAPSVGASLAAFVSAPGYDPSALRADCRRLAFLLGVADSPFEVEEQP